MQTPFGDIIVKGNNSKQVILSYPYDQVLDRDRKRRHKGRELGPSCLMRFLPKIGFMNFDEKCFSSSGNLFNEIKVLNPEYQIGNLGDVIKPKLFQKSKYKMKKIVSHEELLEILEILVQDKVFNISKEKLLMFLGTSKETFYNIFKGFCGYEHERIFTKLDDFDVEREKESRIRRKRKNKEKRLREKKEKGVLSEEDYEKKLKDVYLRTANMKNELEEEYAKKDRDHCSKYIPVDKQSSNLLIVIDCFANLKDYYNDANISSDSSNRKILQYISDNELSNTKLLVIGAHENKISSVELDLYKRVNQVMVYNL